MNTLVTFGIKYHRFLRIGIICAVVAIFLSGSVYGQGGLPGSNPPPGNNPAPAGGPGGGGLQIDPPGGNTDLVQLVNRIADYILTIALPIAFGMIIYAGVLFVIARGDPTKVTNAKNVLKYAIIGLAIILINKGFVTLIADVLGTDTPE